MTGCTFRLDLVQADTYFLPQSFRCLKVTNIYLNHKGYHGCLDVIFYQNIMAEQLPALRIKTLQNLNASRKAPGFLIAALVSGIAWYYQQREIKHFNLAQEEVINRVQFDNTNDKFLKTFDYRKAKEWEGVKVNLDGMLQPGRFMVKRNRGDQQGYIILAPFTIQAKYYDFRDIDLMRTTSNQRKLMLNLGWIPKNSKHQIYQTAACDIIGTETYSFQNRGQALKKTQIDGMFRDPLQADKISPITNVTAYIRVGQKEDGLHGYKNDYKQNLYKFIDLHTLTRAFRIQNEYEGQAIYLERTGKNDEEYQRNPIPANKELVLSELRQQAKEHEQCCVSNAVSVTALSFVAASLLTIL